jgi:hypothetical protein
VLHIYRADGTMEDKRIFEKKGSDGSLGKE